MLIQFDVKAAAGKVKIGLMGVDGSYEMDQVLIALKGHAVSGEIQYLPGCLGYMIAGIGPMQR
jgi:hypothetical protein